MSVDPIRRQCSNVVRTRDSCIYLYFAKQPLIGLAAFQERGQWVVDEVGRWHKVTIARTGGTNVPSLVRMIYL